MNFIFKLYFNNTIQNNVKKLMYYLTDFEKHHQTKEVYFIHLQLYVLINKHRINILTIVPYIFKPYIIFSRN